MGKIPRQTPKVKSKVPYWRFEKMPKGHKFLGWIAGPALGFNVHNVGVSKPCLTELTGGVLECPWHKAFGIQWLSYLPLYDKNGDPVVVGIKRDMEDIVNALDTFTPVEVMRGTEFHSAVQVRPKAWTTGKHSNRPERQNAADIEPWLIHFWGVAEVKDWYRTTCGAASDPTVMHHAAPTITEEQALTERAGKLVTDEVRAKLRNRIAELKDDEPVIVEPSSNGKQTRKPR